MRHPDVLPTIQYNRRELRYAAFQISQQFPSQLSLLFPRYLEFDYNWYATSATRARNWVTERLADITARYDAEEPPGRTLSNSVSVRSTVLLLTNQIRHIRTVPEDPTVNEDTDDDVD